MASLTISQYYDNKNLRNLFSILKIKMEEVIGREFDDILTLVEQSFTELLLKCNPDRNKDNEEQAKRNFQELIENREKLQRYLNDLKARSTPDIFTPSQREARRKQRKIDEILSRRKSAINGALLFSMLADVALAPFHVLGAKIWQWVPILFLYAVDGPIGSQEKKFG